MSEKCYFCERSIEIEWYRRRLKDEKVIHLRCLEIEIRNARASDPEARAKYLRKFSMVQFPKGPGIW